MYIDVAFSANFFVLLTMADFAYTLQAPRPVAIAVLADCGEAGSRGSMDVFPSRPESLALFAQDEPEGGFAQPSSEEHHVIGTVLPNVGSSSSSSTRNSHVRPKLRDESPPQKRRSRPTTAEWLADDDDDDLGGYADGYLLVGGGDADGNDVGEGLLSTSNDAYHYHNYAEGIAAPVIVGKSGELVDARVDSDGYIEVVVAVAAGLSASIGPGPQASAKKVPKRAPGGLGAAPAAGFDPKLFDLMEQLNARKSSISRAADFPVESKGGGSGGNSSDTAGDAGADGADCIAVILEHLGYSYATVVNNKHCTVDALSAHIRKVLELHALQHIYLHYTDAEGDIVELPPEQPTILWHALQQGMATDVPVAISVVQSKRDIVDATARAKRRTDRAEKMLKEKKLVPMRPLSGQSLRSSSGGGGNRASSRPVSIVSLADEQQFPVQLICQQLGLEYVDGTRPLNITRILWCSVYGKDAAAVVGLYQFPFTQPEVQVGDNKDLEEAYSYDRMKGVCHECSWQFKFAKVEEVSSTTAAACSKCNSVNIFLMI